MSSEHPKPKPGRDPRPLADDPRREDDSPVIGNVTGRVKFDDRGNAVWEWAVGTGSPGLGILDDTPPPDRQVKDNPRGADRGYSPYDRGLPGSAHSAAKEPPRRKDLKRLGEWLKLKKQAEANKRGDK